jgi:uncharacterized membrane protein
MTEWQTPEPVPTQDKGTALLCYVLLISSLILFVTGIIGVVVAYVYRDEAPEWLKSHYTLQIRTFWISILMGVVSLPLMMVMIGYLVLLLWVIWFLVRCVKGIRLLNQGRPYPKPQGWWF